MVKYAVSQYVGRACCYLRYIDNVPSIKEEDEKAWAELVEENEADSYFESNMSPILDFDDDED